MKWRDISRKGIVDIGRVAETFEITTGDYLRHFTFTIKIIENKDGSFTGFSNLSVRSRESGEQEYYSGSGNSVEEALATTIDEFMNLINNISDIQDEDFIWVPLEEF